MYLYTDICLLDFYKVLHAQLFHKSKSMPEDEVKSHQSASHRTVQDWLGTTVKSTMCLGCFTSAYDQQVPMGCKASKNFFDPPSKGQECRIPHLEQLCKLPFHFGHLKWLWKTFTSSCVCQLSFLSMPITLPPIFYRL